MRSAIGEGRTDEEALDQALKRLGVGIREVHVEVLEEKRGGLFGLFGARKVRVKVTHEQETEAKIEKILSGLMKRLDISSRVEVKKENGDYHVEIVTVEADGLLIGKHGENLHAIEHLLNRIVHKDRDEQGRVRVDVGGYRARRDEQLRTRALGMARRVKETGREMSTDPLAAPDRRVVHLALTGDSEVRTFTVGDGLYKSVVVGLSGSSRGPARAARGGAGRGGRGGERRRRR